MSPHVALRRITAGQHGLIQRTQLYELGFAPGSVAHLVKQGRLEPLTDRVFRLVGSAQTPDQAAMAAALDVPGGVVASFSAAALMELPSFEVEPIHVLTDRTPHRGRRHLGIVHTSRRFSPTDTMRIRCVPITTPVQTLCDLAAHIHPDRLDLVCERMVSRRLLRVEELHRFVASLPRRGGARGSAALRAVAASRDPHERPTESNLERRFERILAEAGDPAFERQVDLGDGDGWIGRVDFLDRRRRLVVEVQSALFHSSRIDQARDATRFQRLRRAGWTVLEISELDIWYHPHRVLAAVRAARRAV